jgi:O-antigen biosynthesis protein
MNSLDKNRRISELSAAGRYQEALAVLCQLLADSASSERWNDWAALQFRIGQSEEAETGFRLALEQDPTNTQAALNLGALLLSAGRSQEGAQLLAQAAEGIKQEEREAANLLLTKVPPPTEDVGRIPPREVERYLRRFLSQDVNERSYFETHIRRYLATLEMLPSGNGQSRILELGAAFHHITPALLHFKKYGEVVCNDIWRGEKQRIRQVAAHNGPETFSFPVDNFDVQHSPWPYSDGAFDSVLCCEMLEHLHSDPMCLFSEINRVLKVGGMVLLTTPNIAGGHSVEFALRGESPYVYGKFERDGASTDRHNREYTAGEVEELSRAAGLDPVVLRTANSWWSYAPDLMRKLASHGYPISRRGDNTFLLARKQSDVRQRYPEAFYQSTGTQAERRSVQACCVTPTPEAFEPPMLKNILVVHELLPHHDCSGSDLRLLDILRELRLEGHRITYLARSGKDASRYRPDLEALGISVRIGYPEGMVFADDSGNMDWSFADFLAQQRFDIAILCQWFWGGMSVVEQYLTEIRRFSQSTRIAVLSDDRHGERERRAAKLTGLFSDLERAHSFEQRETEAYRQADLVLYITESDKQGFLKLVPELEAMHLPMVAETIPSPGFSDRSGVLFLGNFENPANGDALQWMLAEIWPLVQKKDPHIKLYVAGHGVDKHAREKKPNVICLGKVGDLSPVFDARRVFASPVRYGTGINTKNVQAICRGLPLVATPVGAEGLGLQHEKHALVADSSEQFASEIVRLHGDDSLWQRLAINGQEFAQQNFSRENLRIQLRKIIRRTGEIEPRPFEQSFCWSYREVDRPAIQPHVPSLSLYRVMLRLFRYWVVGRRHMEEARFALALHQFRHAFAVSRVSIPDTVFHRALLSDMARCYHEIGDSQGSERCDRELKNRPRPLAKAKQNNTRTTHLPPETNAKISVVFPTFNRQEILKVALAAWSFQTLPSDRWEVIVVDDGSNDATQQICRTLPLPYRLRYLRQDNRGAGAARRAGVEAAAGRYLLLCNDDTIPDSNLLAEHLAVHRNHPHEKWAVLGNFRPSRECARRALSFFVNTSAFFFPQSTLSPGQLLNETYFATCNLSIGREAVISAGNFDPQFQVAEDTELGARLARRGYRVRYHPQARADHEHGTFTTDDLIRRARAYGRADSVLFAKHPHLLSSAKSPFGTLSSDDLARITHQLDSEREAVSTAVQALEALDRIDFLPLFKPSGEERPPADALLEKLGSIVPLVYWHHLLEQFLECHREKRSESQGQGFCRQTQVIAS